MTGKRIGKVLLAWLCIITLLMPMASNVLAVTKLTNSDSQASLETIPLREGGKESTNIGSTQLHGEQYDENKYEYSINDVNVLKIVQSDDTDYLDTFYCLNAEKSFSITSSGYQYTKVADDLTDYNDENVKEWADSIGLTQEKFNSLMYLLNNIYAKKLNTNYKDTYLSEVFADTIEDSQDTETPTTLEYIKTVLTDDDIEVVQQWAIWYFTNSEKSLNGTTESEDTTSSSGERVKGTKDNNYRSHSYDDLGDIKVKKMEPTMNEEGKFEMSTEAQSLEEKPRQEFAKTLYQYLIDDAETSANYETENINPNNRHLSLWTGEKDNAEDSEDDDNTLQPVVLITEEENGYDLALRKFIVSVNGVATSGRVPTPTQDSLSKLADGTVKTADYHHAKSPVTVKPGDKIVFEFRIYNEGNVDAQVKEIVDYLPEGLEVISNDQSTINSNANWEVENDKLVNKHLADKTIKAFDKTTKTISYEKVQLECLVKDNLDEGLTLTNVAEILLDNGTDRDSKENSIDPSTITDSYKGNKSNKDDLSDTNYHYKGLEDDDDFEKVVIAGKQFDLSLQKFISSINKEDQNRAPKVDVEPLKNGKEDAEYTTTKSPVQVETGDIVTFTLRVYNEGEVDGYAEEIMDYIPEGLGFLVNYKTNYDNRWKISNDSKSVKLSSVRNGTSNLSKSDFVDIDDLDNVDVVLGQSKITSSALASSETSTSNLIKAFDGTTLSYKDVQVSFIVVTEDEMTLKNIAAITAEKDKDKNPVETDRTPGKDSTPGDDIDPDKYTTGNEDDDDYDVVKTGKENFDLALQKFISGLNNDEVTDREPVVSSTNGQIKYTHPKSTPLYVGNGDLITYTIRVYNEGDIDGYAAEIRDNIPNGLTFVPENDTNKEYGWEMYDNSGNKTTDPDQAVEVRTTYLSKESSDSNLIGKFDGTTLLYKDVKLVFKVDESAIDKTITSEKRTLINIAEITKNTDSEGKDIQDSDSTPGNNNPDEDDIDRENVYVKYFDLALEKTLNKAIVTTNGDRKEITGDGLKVEIHRKSINQTTIQFVYNVKVTNQGEIEGYATEVTDRIPNGLRFNKEANPDWTEVSDGVIKTNALAKTLLKPGESAQIEVVLDWVQSAENIGEFDNVAEITEDWNPYDSDDVDSTPGNNNPKEDDQDDAPVWVGITTGLDDQPYIILPTAFLMILATGVILIKKYVL